MSSHVNLAQRRNSFHAGEGLVTIVARGRALSLFTSTYQAGSRWIGPGLSSRLVDFGLKRQGF